jgi:two-component system NarL family sensor kinase
MLILRCIDVPFAVDERTGLRAITHRIALAIENGRLHAQLGQLLERNVAIAEQERSRVALDLHDGPIQHLTVAALKFDLFVMQLQNGGAVDVAQASELRGVLSDEITSLRRLMTGLRPPVLDESGLDAAMHDSALRVFEDVPVTVDITTNLNGARLAPAIETILFRLTREALTNVRKHAQATRVDIRLVLDETNVSLTICDDGVGFGILPADIRAEHLGLVSMGELAESVGGRCTVVSTPGQGVEVQAVVPRREACRSDETEPYTGRWGIT